jgi:antitoxin CptB
MSDLETRLARLKFRAWHRGTRESDYMMGCFFDRYHGEWGEAEVAWFEALLEVDDPHIMDWAMGKAAIPAEHAGPWMDALMKLDYVEIPR